MASSHSSSSKTWKRHSTRQWLVRTVLLFAVIGSFLASWLTLDMTTTFLLSAPREFSDLLARMYPPDIGYLPNLVGPIIETINISILGTFLAIVFAAPVALLGAENTTLNRGTYLLAKFIIASTRSVNVIIWALIMVIVFGSGALAGILAIAVRSIGFTAKILAESIEEIDSGSVEAIRATGASRTQVILYGIISQIKPAFITVATLRWDINVRGATVLGLVGAGGIGVTLISAINQFAWRTAATVLIIIVVLVIVSEAISVVLRRGIR